MKVHVGATTDLLRWKLCNESVNEAAPWKRWNIKCWQQILPNESIKISNSWHALIGRVDWLSCPQSKSGRLFIVLLPKLGRFDFWFLMLFSSGWSGVELSQSAKSKGILRSKKQKEALRRYLRRSIHRYLACMQGCCCVCTIRVNKIKSIPSLIHDSSIYFAFKVIVLAR